LKTFVTALSVAGLAAGLALSLVGCAESEDTSVADDPALSAPVPDGMVRGKVLETMNSGGYTYVFIETDSDKRWVATTEFAVSEGDVVQASAGMPMRNFESKTLNRTFDVVYFADRIENLSAPAPAGG
jgi:major membrane immunogen (membrane-anchored lipoprotein)